MAARPPADAVVALRSLGRRFRGLFAGREDDESPDDLAHRIGPDGHAAIDHVVADHPRPSRSSDRALEQVLRGGRPGAAPGRRRRAAARLGREADGTVDERLDELAAAADGLADRVERVAGGGLGPPGQRRRARRRRAARSGVLWDAVDSAIEHLRAAERTLDAVRGRA